jgi:hypothetical protein
LAELEEKKKAEKAKKKPVTEPYGEELKPKPAPVVKPQKIEEEPEEEPEIENKELERFSGDNVSLTQEEFNALMKHADLGQKVLQSGMVEGVPKPVQPPKLVSQEPQTLGEQIQAEKDAIQMAEEQEFPEGAFEDIEPPKKKRRPWSRRKGPTVYEEGDKLSTKPTILYYDTDNTCKMVTGKLNKDGSLQIDERLFDFSEGQPSILSIGRGKGRSSAHPFYILRYDNMRPVDINDYPDSNPTPEQASRLVELKTLETLSRIEGGKMRKGPLIIIMLASFFGGFVLKMMLGLLGIW